MLIGILVDSLVRSKDARTRNANGRIDMCVCIYIYGGFPKLGVPFWGVPIIRTLGSILGSPYLGKLPCVHMRTHRHAKP